MPTTGSSSFFSDGLREQPPRLSLLLRREEPWEALPTGISLPRHSNGYPKEPALYPHIKDSVSDPVWENPHGRQGSSSFFHRFFANDIHSQSFAHIVSIHLISRFQCDPLRGNFLQDFCILPFPPFLSFQKRHSLSVLQQLIKSLYAPQKSKTSFFICIFFPCISVFMLIFLLFLFFITISILLQLSR